MGYPETDFEAADDQSQTRDQRGARRYTSLIRSAKLISGSGEFVCVIRDVSSSGISLRAFHRLPSGDRMALELPNGETFELKKVRSEGREGSFTFLTPVPVETLIRETTNYPKRQLRLNIEIPVAVACLTGRGEAITRNLSQQGACIDCDVPFAIDQTVKLTGGDLPEIRAKVRWRRAHEYGLVFDTTFSLADFARLAAAIQSPVLLDA
ncbi:MAG: PilZ domain-containing protein [Erythrobacter sp.]|nr:PilZ domain-containing protein [Erythrobacter sp.]